MKKFSVLMSVYYKEKPEFLDKSLESILVNQTIKPDEIVMVKDGKLTKELELVLEKYTKKYPKTFRFVVLKKNKGLGYALRKGLKACKNDLVMRMDTDDIAINNRFEIQVNYMENNKDVVAVGGNIAEFYEDYMVEKLRIKSMPSYYENLVKYSKFRNPLNHMTVCFRKNEILSVGNYEQLLLLEDYWLWARLLVANKKIANIPEILSYVRIGNGFHKRRCSKVIIKSWKKLQKYFYKNKFINFYEFCRNMTGIYVIVYTPEKIKKMLYNNFLRDKKGAKLDEE